MQPARRPSVAGTRPARRVRFIGGFLSESFSRITPGRGRTHVPARLGCPGRKRKRRLDPTPPFRPSRSVPPYGFLTMPAPTAPVTDPPAVTPPFVPVPPLKPAPSPAEPEARTETSCPSDAPPERLPPTTARARSTGTPRATSWVSTSKATSSPRSDG